MATAKKTGTKKMTKAEIMAHIADEATLSKKQVEGVFDSLFGLMQAQLGKNGPGEITLPNIVKLRVAKKAATKDREGRNPATGEKITIKGKPAHKVVKATILKPTKELAK
jgi:nucleoid DNA-binding protein